DELKRVKALCTEPNLSLSLRSTWGRPARMLMAATSLRLRFGSVQRAFTRFSSSRNSYVILTWSEKRSGFDFLLMQPQNQIKDFSLAGWFCGRGKSSRDRRGGFGKR